MDASFIGYYLSLSTRSMLQLSPDIQEFVSKVVKRKEEDTENKVGMWMHDGKGVS